MEIQTNRRALLGAIALAPAMAVPAAAASSTAVNPGLAAAIARHRATKAKMEQFSRDVYEPVREAWQAACDAVPHRTVSRTFLNYAGERRRYSTADDQVVLARRFLNDPKPYAGDLAEYREACAELVALEDARNAELKGLRQRFNIDPLFKRLNELEEETSRAFDAVADYEVITLPDLLAKITVLEAEGWLFGEPTARLLAADAKRVAAGRVAA